MKSRIDAANVEGCDFPLQNLPYGVFSTSGGPRRCGVAIGDQILDLAAAEAQGLIDARGTFAAPQLNDFIALGRPVWDRTRARLTELLAEGATGPLPLVPMAEATLHLPIRVSEYTDFYASKNHAFNVGALFRGPENALPAQWTHMPIGYNGRASSVVVSGTDIRRPMGQLKGEAGPVWGPSRRLDLELELGAIVGCDTPSARAAAVTLPSAATSR